MTNFGASFKKARESRGLSFAQIAEETRISARFLEAIENEDFQLLPGGIFNRGFIRTYASCIGLDPEAAVKEYEELVHIPQPEPLVTPKETPPTPLEPTNNRNFYAPLAIGVLALAIVIFYAVTRETENPVSSTAPPAVAVTEQVPSTPLTQAVSAAPEPAGEPTPARTSAITLDIQATDETWIKVNADGTNVSPGEILEPGVTRHFTAHTSLNIVIGNAGGLNLKLNDQTVKAIGKVGQVREIVLTPDNLKDFIE